MASVEDHLAAVLRAATPLPAERTTIDTALGRTLAEPVHAESPLPAFDNSAMDGFAVRFADVSGASADSPVELRVEADLPAGTTDDPRLPADTAARIMTGAPLPADADTVIPFEDTALGLDDSLVTATVTRAPRSAGAHVRRRGEDVTDGAEVLAAGTALGPLHLAAAAAVGVRDVVVARAPRVAVIATGSELVEPGTALQRGLIPESNGRMLAALAIEAGCTVVHRTRVTDDASQLLAVLAEVTDRASTDRADVVLFSGGVSAGAFEVVKQALTETMSFTTVAMRPGMPQGFGILPDGTLLFGLPGNPVSAAVSFEVFVRPALLRMQGRPEVQRPTLRLPVSSGWLSPSDRRHYVPVSVDRSYPGGWSVTPAGPGGSHRAGALARADGYAVVPVGVDEVEAGDLVDVLLTS